MVEEDGGAHENWVSSCSGERWFSLALAEDWVRLALLLPLSCAPRGSRVSLHSFGPTQAALRESIPSWARVRRLVSRDCNPAELSALLAAQFDLPRGVPLIVDVFWGFVARFAHSLAIPTSSDVAAMLSPQALTRPGRMSLSPYYSAHSGFGLKVSGPASAGSQLDCLWGECLPLEEDHFAILDGLKTASSLSIVLGDGSEVRHLALGPLALLNHSCTTHCNVVPESGPLSARSPSTGLCPEDWTGGTLSEDVSKGSRLFVSYGDSYSSGADQLDCPLCPWPGDTPNREVHDEWAKLSDRPWFPLALADDWVTVSALCPMAGVDPTLVTLHAVGRTRLSLIECAPSLDLIKNLMKAHSREAALATALGGKFDLSRLGVVFPKAKFWAPRLVSSNPWIFPRLEVASARPLGPVDCCSAPPLPQKGSLRFRRLGVPFFPFPTTLWRRLGRLTIAPPARSCGLDQCTYCLVLFLYCHTRVIHTRRFTRIWVGAPPHPGPSGRDCGPPTSRVAPPFQPYRPTRCCATPTRPSRGRRGHKLTTFHWSALGACLIRLRALPLLLLYTHPRHLPPRPRPRAVLFALPGFAPLR